MAKDSLQTNWGRGTCFQWRMDTCNTRKFLKSIQTPFSFTDKGSWLWSSCHLVCILASRARLLIDLNQTGNCFYVEIMQKSQLTWLNVYIINDQLDENKINRDIRCALPWQRFRWNFSLFPERLFEQRWKKSKIA